MAEKKRKLPHFSIKFHIFSTMIALTLIMIAVLWIFQGFFLNTAFKLTKESDVERAAKLISENIESNNAATLISQVAVGYNICVRVYDPVAEADIYNQHFLNDCALHKLTNEQSLLNSWYNKAKENGGEYSEIFPMSVVRQISDSDDSDILSEATECIFFTKIISSPEGDEYMLILNASIVPMKSTTRVIRIMIITLSLAIFIISVLISYILSKRLSKPIENISSYAKELQAGDYTARFVEENGPCEFVELSKTLNATAIQLDNADRIQKELVANISHDLRTPLTMISGYSEFIRDFPSEATPENMQVIIDETARLNSLVNDLLDVSKLQSGTQKINIQKISLTKAIKDTVARYTTLKSHTEYKIIFEGGDTEVFVMADETRLLQVVYNLVNNAINYTGDDKTVTVRQEVLDDTVRISIIDTGEGISEENLPLIWDRYYKVDKVHKRAILGTGLGLSIVKNILILHDSRFGVSSEVGKGSTFWFEFKTV